MPDSTLRGPLHVGDRIVFRSVTVLRSKLPYSNLGTGVFTVVSMRLPFYVQVMSTSGQSFITDSAMRDQTELFDAGIRDTCQECATEIGHGGLCTSCGLCRSCCMSAAESCCAGCGWPNCADLDSTVCAFCGNCETCDQCTHHSCPGCDEDAGSEYCGDCGYCTGCGCTCNNGYDDSDSDDSGLRSYSTNVISACGADIPHGVRTYGIELEVVADSHAEQENIIYALGRSPLRSQWVAKSDGSLPSNGVELVSVPLAMPALLDAIKTLFREADLEARITRCSDAGTHIHVGRSGVDIRTITRAWYPWHFASRDYSRSDGVTIAERQRTMQRRDDMYRLLRGIAGRDQTHYCRWDAPAPVDLSMRRCEYNGHYSAVSTSDHYDTYEFRMFSGVTHEVSALRFLESLDMMLAIAHETHGVNVLTDAALYTREIGKRIEAYPALWSTIRKPSARISAFHSQVDAARAGTPKKMRPKSTRAGVDAPSTSLRPTLHRAFQGLERTSTLSRLAMEI